MTPPPDPTLVATALLARYCHLVDRGPWDAIDSLFEVDCSVDVPGKHLEGRDGVHRFYEKRSHMPIVSRHVVSNVVATLHDSGDLISSIATLTLFREHSGVKPVLVADSIDVIARTGDVWLFREKRIVPVFQAAPAPAPVPAPVGS